MVHFLGVLLTLSTPFDHADPAVQRARVILLASNCQIDGGHALGDPSAPIIERGVPTTLSPYDVAGGSEQI
jgi:hypothetical protein